ncbi:MAG: metal ABC transporter permease [Anaeromicrobium sp.]|uniref:metal ABC transporter permease n=1 Tax=Anaeromicrobium sp. TaxID=1929132 RepID=UPI0025E2ACEF|nr:metal ABC transporter permease [Anaeromicrobium sp.]MCT4592935.1 metal ABC transporter permease [Anaeromicrobium sp.]
MFYDLFQYEFIGNAIKGAFLASIVCGIIGTIVVEKSLVSMSGGITHASFGGIGLAYYLGIEPMIGALIFSTMASLGVSAIKRNTNTKADTLIGMFWSLGMALGILFINLTPGYPPDMTSYLFGDILTISSKYINMMMVLTMIILVSIGSIFNYWKAYLFDEEFSKSLGINILTLENLLYILIAFSIVILIKVVGIILVIALLTIPVATAKLLSYNLKKVMILSSIFGITYSLSGLYISYEYNIPSGATIILVSICTYIITSVGVKLVKNKEVNFI